MSAVQGSTHGSGAGNPSTGNENDGKIRKFEAVIILLVGMVAGMAAGIAKRMMDHSSYFEAIVSGVVVGFALPGFIIMIIKYVRNQS
ncbi:hypothetical protein AB0H69_09555 [Streptomyces phaeochromogenes]|uniref:hypothetical protein n=1 Tax=Streptomyces phaeochromogenes TaxID=1923 RepID=UPI0033D6219C